MAVSILFGTIMHSARGDHVVFSVLRLYNSSMIFFSSESLFSSTINNSLESLEHRLSNQY